MVNVGLKRAIASNYLEPEKLVVLYFSSQLQLYFFCCCGPKESILAIAIV